MTIVRPGDRPGGEVATVAPAEGAAARLVGCARSVYWLSGALLLVVCAASGLTFFGDGILTGPAAMNGSARGTALVLLVLTAPVMVVAMAIATRGSVRAVTVWLGALGVIVYNAQMFLYATPFNQLFLLYVAMLGLSVWSVVALLANDTVGRMAERMSPEMPVRRLAGYVWAIAALNALLWLRTILPAVLGDNPGSVLDGTGISTNPVFVQDLALWLPLAAVSAMWLWRRQVWGYALVGGMLTMWVLEGVTVAVDQWFGSQADPASTVVSSGMVVPMGVLVMIGLVPMYLFLRSVSGAHSEAGLAT